MSLSGGLSLGLGGGLNRFGASGGVQVPSLMQADSYANWYPRTQAVYDATTGRTVFGRLGSAGEQQVCHYDPATGRITVQTVRAAYASGKDTHNQPVVHILQNGRAVVATAGHNEQLNVRRAGSFDGKIGSLMAVALPDGGSCSYPFLAQMNDTAKTLYIEYRTVVIGSPNQWRRRTNTSTTGGFTWGTAVTWLTDESGTLVDRPYPLLAHRPGTSRVDFVTTKGHWAEVSGNYLSHGYWQVDSGGTRTWYTSDGTLLGDDTALPFTPASFTKIDGPDAGVTNYNWTDLAWVDESGTPVLTLLYTRMTPYSSSTTHTFYRTRLVSGAWTTPEEITDAGPVTPHQLYTGFWHSPAGAGVLDRLDANKVYLFRKYGANNDSTGGGDIRGEVWTRNGGGTWAKSMNVTGATGDKNFFPVWVEGSVSRQLLYSNGTANGDTTWDTDVKAWPALTVAANPSGTQSKPTSPVLNSAVAARLYPGLRFFIPFTEGTGTTAADLSGNGFTGTLTGGLSWEVGTLGPQVIGFDASNRITVACPSQPVGDGVFPCWTIAVFSTTGTTSQDVLCFGRSSDSVQQWRHILNNAAAGQAGFHSRGSGGTGSGSNTAASVNNGAVRVMQCVWFSATEPAYFLDGVLLAAPTSTTLSPLPVFDQLTVGASKLAGSFASPFTNGKVVAVLGGKGGCPDPVEAYLDLSTGAFEALR